MKKHNLFLAICNLTPFELSKVNQHYFSVLLQTGRDVYHHAVVHSNEQHSKWNIAARSCSAIKIKNAKKTPSLPFKKKKKDFMLLPISFSLIV